VDSGTMTLPGPAAKGVTAVLSPSEARQIVTQAIRAHFQKVRSRIPAFVDRTYGWIPALKINARGLGKDMVRAPLNAALVLPHFGLRLAARGFARAGRDRTAQWLNTRQLFLKTDVAREIEWRVWTELLELPYRDGGRVSAHDGLAAEILSHPCLRERLIEAERAYGRHVSEDALKDRLAQAFVAYGESRAAAAEVASAFACLGAGAALLGQFTPSILTLGPALANLVATKVAAAGGGTLTALWLGIVPVKAGAATTVAVTAGAYLAAAAATAVSGAATDPIQRHLGLHERRLHGMVDAIELALLGDTQAKFTPHDHYAGRLIDLADVLTAAWRLVPR
jgi:hypothetical protein